MYVEKIDIQEVYCLPNRSAIVYRCKFSDLKRDINSLMAKTHKLLKSTALAVLDWIQNIGASPAELMKLRMQNIRLNAAVREQENSMTISFDKIRDVIASDDLWIKQNISVDLFEE